MRILTRYILLDLLKVFLLTLTGLTLLIFIVLIGKEAVDKGIGLNVLLQIVPYMIPQAMQFAVPGTMLLATTSVYGRIASYNEIVAIKSLGISPMVLVWPTLALATLVSFAAVVINDTAVSWGMMGQQSVVNRCMEEIAYRQLKLHNTYNFGKANIMVRDVIDRKLIQPRLIVHQSPDRPPWIASATDAELHLMPDEGKLVIRFHDVDVDGPIIWINPETQEFVAPIEELTGSTPKNRSPSNYALAEIRARNCKNKSRLWSESARAMWRKLLSGCSWAILIRFPPTPGSRTRETWTRQKRGSIVCIRSLGAAGRMDSVVCASC